MRVYLVAPLFLAAALLLAGTGCKREDKAADLTINDVPEDVMKVAREKLPNVKFDQAWKTRKGNWEVRGKSKDGKVRDIQVTPKGEVVEVD